MEQLIFKEPSSGVVGTTVNLIKRVLTRICQERQHLDGIIKIKRSDCFIANSYRPLKLGLLAVWSVQLMPYLKLHN